MVEFLKSRDEVLAFSVQGLEAEDYEDIAEALDLKLKRQPQLRLVVDLTSLDLIKAQAVAKRVAYNMARVGEWKKFPRLALIADRSWLSPMARICAALIPRVEMKIFEPFQKAEAMRWSLGFDTLLFDTIH